MKFAQKAFLFISCSILAFGLGIILADEVHQRWERAEFRDACYQMQVEQLGEAPNEMQDMILRFQCRTNIP
jgi:hypothetical protein